MKKKILYIITKSDVGGAQKYVHDLAEKLDKEKFEIEILTGGLSTSSRQAKIRFLSNAFRPYLLFINDWLAIAELFLILHKKKPDILHLNSSKAGVIGSLAAMIYKVNCQLSIVKCTPPKVVFTAHGWVFNPDNDLSWPLRRFYIFLHKIAARFQDKIINVSEYDRQLAIKHKIAPAEKLVTVYNGIDYKNLKFLDKQVARKQLMKMLDRREPTKVGSRDDTSTVIASDTPSVIASDTPSVIASEAKQSQIWIGSVGRLVKEKNYETFIEAASLIRNPKVKFFIIGSGPERKKLEMGIERLGLRDRFFIIENLAPAAPCLKALDVFILSSIKEGLPYTLLEAMAAGLPIVTTRVGGMAEIIEPAEGPKAGLVMPPKEAEELARAINHLLEDRKKAQEFAINAQLFLKNKLGMEKMLEKTVALYMH